MAMRVEHYDPNNIFAKILRGELPCDKVYEDEYALAFHDIRPDAPVHVLVIPRGEYIALHDFALNAPPELMSGFWAAVAKTAEKLGLEKNGYRVITNNGADALQMVFHFHAHILGGKSLGRLLP